MGQGQVPDAERGVLAEDTQVGVDHVAAFHAHERGDLALRHRAPDVRGGCGQHQFSRAGPDGLPHHVDLLQRALDGLRPGHAGGHVNGEEQRIEAALAHSRDVDAAGSASGADVERGLGHHPLCRVVVRVDNDGAGVKVSGMGRDDLVLAHLLSPKG